MGEMRHIGELAIARVLGFKNSKDEAYKIWTEVLTGNLKGKPCYVAYRGNEPDIKISSDNILIRLDKYNHKQRTKMKFKETDYTGRFITSEIPDNFDYDFSVNTIFYAFWKDEMKKGFNIPIIAKIGNYFNPGPMPKTLHCVKENGSVVVYHVMNKKDSYRSKDREKLTKNFENSLDKHIHANKQRDRSLPCVVTIDDTVDFKDVLLVFNLVKFAHHTNIEHFIEMEPQQ